MTEPEAEAVERTFAGIARRYDLANRLLSFGMDCIWRRRLVRMVASAEPKNALDLATGSGDVALSLRDALPADTEVIGLDFCQPMLDEAVRKARLAGETDASRLRFVRGDCLDLPFEEASVDALTIAFGLRNLEDRALGLAEMRRVLRPGGSLFVLEFSQPACWLRPFYYLYLKAILPLLAWVITRDRSAYQYLGATISKFPDLSELKAELEAAGFDLVTASSLTGSIVAIHHGVKEA